jgi:hypothetical protein
MYLINTVLVMAMIFFFFLPINDCKTARMKLCVIWTLALVLTVSVSKTHPPEPRVASLSR